MPRLKAAVASENSSDRAESAIEMLLLTAAQQQYLRGQSNGLNPDMPLAFGAAHVVRTLLERVEESGMDLSEASSEEELTRVATAGLRRQTRGQRRSRR